MHETFAVIGSSDGSEPTIGIVCALKTNKQRRRRMVQSFYTVSTKVSFCDVCMYKSVCVAVEFLNFNEIIRHALQTNHGSAPTREAHSAKIHNVLQHNATPNPNINTAAENFGARLLPLPEHGEALRFA